MRKLYNGFREVWEDGLGGEVWRVSVSFVILALLALAVCTAVPSLRTALADMIIAVFNGMELTGESGSISALALFAGNLRACAVIMLYGLVPFLPLTALSLGLNAMIPGVLAALYLSEGLSPLLYFALLIPHGIFELPALILAFAMGLYVCGQVTRLCRRDAAARPVLGCLALEGQLLVFVLLPLLAAAAVMEAYVTPAVASFFL